ncbi:DUF4352 domain-containing protein [Nocardia sp. NBC_00416]|uniref:DUF4352 domain-containing protein n=1 Tax=Nocardia sp. NBC_00416 TaxID=2975991 RepID=UPI002E1CE701
MDRDRDEGCALRQPEQGETLTHQPYPPQQHYGAHPPQRPKKKTTWPWLLLAGVLVLCGFGGCLAVVSNSASDKTTSAAAAGDPAAGDSDIAAAGTPVRDGKFEFVVTKVDTGLKTVGSNPYLQKEAQGQYVLVHTTVTNTSDRPQSYFGSNQKLIDAQGREFTNDTMAEVNVNDTSVMGGDINPGNAMEVIIAFDIPAAAQPATLEFHDSMLSGGVRVALQ